MGIIRIVDLNPKRAKLGLTFKLLGIFAPILTLALIILHPVEQLAGRSFWLYPLIFLVRLAYVLCGPALSGFYLHKKFGLTMIGPPAAIGAIALLLWLSVFFKNKLHPQVIFLPIALWLIAGGWTTFLMLAAGK